MSSLLEPRFDLQIEFCAGIVGVGEVGEVPVRLLQTAFATSWKSPAKSGPDSTICFAKNPAHSFPANFAVVFPRG